MIIKSFASKEELTKFTSTRHFQHGYTGRGNPWTGKEAAEMNKKKNEP